MNCEVDGNPEPTYTWFRNGDYHTVSCQILTSMLKGLILHKINHLVVMDPMIIGAFYIATQNYQACRGFFNSLLAPSGINFITLNDLNAFPRDFTKKQSPCDKLSCPLNFWNFYSCRKEQSKPPVYFKLSVKIFLFKLRFQEKVLTVIPAMRQ